MSLIQQVVLTVGPAVVAILLMWRKDIRRAAAYELIAISSEIEDIGYSVMDARLAGDHVAVAKGMEQFRQIEARQSILHRRLGYTK